MKDLEWWAIVAYARSIPFKRFNLSASLNVSMSHEVTDSFFILTYSKEGFAEWLRTEFAHPTTLNLLESALEQVYGKKLQVVIKVTP